jgi:putative FmdB family regulatory protein
MPIYEYGCKHCDHTFEIWQKIKSRRKRKCPECGQKNALNILLGRTSFKLKGGGWYKDGYSNGSNKEPN